MENLGALALILAFCFAIYAVIGSVVGRLRRKPFLTASAERAVFAVWGLVVIASGILVYSLMGGDFRLAYVAMHSNKAMPFYYKFASWWGGQEGSLLFWTFLLTTYSTVVVWTSRRKFREMMPWIVAVLMTTAAFFLLLITVPMSPFNVLTLNKGVTDVGDGQGLTPLLQ